MAKQPRDARRSGPVKGMGINEQVIFLNSVLESFTGHAIVAMDLHGTILKWNEGARRTYGYEAADVVGKATAFTLYHPDDVKSGRAKAILDEAVRTGKWEGELRRVRKNGSQFTAHVTLALRRDPTGGPIGVTMISRDLTGSEQIARELRESQEYNRGLIEANVDALMTTDPLGIITDANKQMCAITGYSREDLIGTPFKRYFTDPQRAEDGIRKVLAEDRMTNYELTMRSQTGKETVVSYNAATFKGANGRLRGVFAVARDITEQKRLEEELRQAQNYTRGLMESSVDSMVTVDQSLTITDVNEQMVRLTEVPKERLIGSRFDGYFTEPDRAAAGVRKTLGEGHVTNYELTLRTPGGREVLVSFNASIFKDTKGNVRGICAVARDVTEQRRLELQLRELQNYSRGVIEASVEALMTVDPHGVITDVNEQTVRLTGCNRQQLIGSPFARVFTDPRRAEDGIRKVLAEGQVTNYELTIRAQDGGETVVAYNATTFKGEDGRLRGIFAAAREIANQKRLEQQITQQYREEGETTAFLNNILESFTEYSIIAKDLDGNVLAWNEGARRNYGYTAEEMVGRQNSRILHLREDLESGKVEAALATALRTGKFEGEFQRLRKGGEQFTARLAITVRRDASGNPIGYLLISKDITAQKVLEDELRRKNEEFVEQYHRVQEASRLKSEGLANLSHELRTPLNGIIGFAEMMHDGKVGPVSPPHKEYLGDILTSSRHLLQLINDVLDLAKVEAGKMPFHPEPVDFAGLVGEVRDGLRALAVNKRIRVKTEIAPALTGVLTDPSKLKQLLYNYLSNALKFTPEGGQVVVRVGREDDDFFRIEVEDTGIGIRPEDVGRLFVEFQQLDANLAKKYPGTGLGLALTKRIVEAQGGRVGVQSTPGAGSVFSAVLPRALRAGWESGTGPGAPPPVVVKAGAPALLVVEDDPKDRAWLIKTLGGAGYAVEAAANGAEALARCREKAFDAITLDLLLPDMKGWDVLKAVRAEGRNPNTPVIAVTVVADKGGSEGLRIDDLLIKPVRAEDLWASLQRVGVPPDGHRTVLVVDDDLRALKLMEAALTELGCRPVCTPDGESGLRVAAAARLSAVVLDLLMRGMSGHEFLNRFRRTANGRHTPVIVWTGADLTAREQRRLKAVAQAVVLKGQGGVAPILKELQAYLPSSP